MIVLNAAVTATRLGIADFSGLDLLELFAFVHPARFAVPTPAGLARALGLAPPVDDARPAFLIELRQRRCSRAWPTPEGWAERDGAWNSAQSLGRLRWPVGTARDRPAGAALRPSQARTRPVRAAARMGRSGRAAAAAQRPARRGRDARPARQPRRRWRRAARGAEILCRRQCPRIRSAHRRRPPQSRPRRGGHRHRQDARLSRPRLALGGRARRGGAVWISTFTKALQRQLDKETTRLFPDPAERREKVVVRKGRENYLCLLNLEDALQGGFQNRAAILAQLVARWAMYSHDGDMVGGDLPGWLPTLFRRAGSTALTDRRGECVYAGCPHYRKCFIERSARASEGGRDRHRQPCAGDDRRLAQRAAPTKCRNSAGSSLTKAIICSTPPI